MEIGREEAVKAVENTGHTRTAKAAGLEQIAIAGAFAGIQRKREYRNEDYYIAGKKDE